MRAFDVPNRRVVFPSLGSELVNSVTCQALSMKVVTYMVSNVENRSVRGVDVVLLAPRYHVREFPLMDVDIYPICGTEGNHLHVVTVSSTFSH